MAPPRRSRTSVIAIVFLALPVLSLQSVKAQTPMLRANLSATVGLSAQVPPSCGNPEFEVSERLRRPQTWWSPLAFHFDTNTIWTGSFPMRRFMAVTSPKRNSTGALALPKCRSEF